MIRFSSSKTFCTRTEEERLRDGVSVRWR